LFAFDWATASDYATVGEFVMTAIILIGTLYAAWLALPKLFNHARVIYERDFYKNEVKMLKDLVEPMKAAAEMLSSVDQRLSDMERVQIVSIRYIADLLVFIQVEDPTQPIPELPPELRDDVLEALKERQKHRADSLTRGPLDSSGPPYYAGSAT
jgi:hypothetical protein